MSLTFFSKAGSRKQPQPTLYCDATRTKNLFHIVAHGLLHLIRTQQVTDLERYNALLTQHAIYFPKQLPQRVHHLSAKEQFDYLTTYTHPHMSVLEPSLGYTIQQMAVDVICQKPSIYGSCLIDGHTPQSLRSAKTILQPPSLIQAIADEVLQIAIYIENYAKTNCFPIKEYYSTESTNSAKLWLKLKDNYYTTPSDIEGSNLDNSTPAISLPLAQRTPLIEQPQELVDRRMHLALSKALKRYNEHLSWVIAQLEQGKLSKNQLRTIAISSYHQQTYLSLEEQTLRNMFVDPNFIALTDQGSTIKSPTIWEHLTAIGLTTGKLTYEQFPAVCFDCDKPLQK